MLNLVGQDLFCFLQNSPNSIAWQSLIENLIKKREREREREREIYMRSTVTSFGVFYFKSFKIKVLMFFHKLDMLCFSVSNMPMHILIIYKKSKAHFN